MTTKERAWEVIQRLPDGISMDRLIYELQVVQRIECALAEADRGETIPHEEVERMFGVGSNDGAD